MLHGRWLLAVLVCCGITLEVRAQGLRPHTRQQLNRVNMCLHGQVLDFTHNHGHDRRIWSPALCERRDMYVYLPPNYDPTRKYAFGIYLHGATQDEQAFLEKPVKLFDQAIANGELPPVILVAPDGSIQGRPSFFQTASFFANTKAGNFEDFIMQDVWNFMMENFSIRPEREAHALMGVSMGGCGAFALAMKHKEKIKIACGVMPALNLRWVDCHGKYEGKFDPDCWGSRSFVRPLEVIGRPGAGIVKVRYCTLLGPLTGKGPEAQEVLACINPLDIMERTNLQDGELSLYVAYGGRDEFNIDSQVESFLYRAKQRGINVTVDFDPCGRHDLVSGVKCFSPAMRWVAPLVASYFPDAQPRTVPATAQEE